MRAPVFLMNVLLEVIVAQFETMIKYKEYDADTLVHAFDWF